MLPSKFSVTTSFQTGSDPIRLNEGKPIYRGRGHIGGVRRDTRGEEDESLTLNVGDKLPLMRFSDKGDPISTRGKKLSKNPEVVRGDEIPSRLLRGLSIDAMDYSKIPFNEAMRMVRDENVSLSNGTTLENTISFLQSYGNRRGADSTPHPPPPMSRPAEAIDFLPHAGRSNKVFRNSYINEFAGFRCRVVMPEGGLNPKFIIVCLHGYGGDIMCLEMIASIFQSCHPLPVTWIFPEGQEHVDEDGVSGHAWFGLGVNFLQFAKKFSSMINSKEVFDVSIRFSRFIGVLLKTWKLTVNELGLVGFSQGAIVAADVFMTLPMPPRFLCLYSAAPIGLRRWKEDLKMMELGGKEDKARLSSMRSRRLLIVHGHHDYMVPRRINRPLCKFFSETLQDGQLTSSAFSMLDHDEGHTMPNWTILAGCSFMRDCVVQSIDKPMKSKRTRAFVAITGSSLVNMHSFKVTVFIGGRSTTAASPMISGLDPFYLGEFAATHGPILFTLRALKTEDSRRSLRRTPSFMTSPRSQTAAPPRGEEASGSSQYGRIESPRQRNPEGGGNQQEATRRRSILKRRPVVQNLVCYSHIPNSFVRSIVKIEGENRSIAASSGKLIIMNVEAPVLEPDSNETVGNLSLEFYLLPSHTTPVPGGLWSSSAKGLGTPRSAGLLASCSRV
eukprot:GHVH01001318.1.p1 GENE.GHVH01001318.1~~GHVH01001318.1.p1  ORF type:complete len:669 (+),score=94.73 GHVH01001318.1:123-2129(+)